MSSRRQLRGFTLIETLIVIAVVLIMVSVAVSSGHKMMMAARETSVISEIQTIHEAQTQYYAQFNNYAANLAELGPPATGPESAEAAGLIPRHLAEGRRRGYTFTMAGNQIGYAIAAMPDVYGSSGRRTFYSDHSQVIRHNWSAEPATIASPEITQ
jgi:type IV pilus assembly protein PilA